MTFSNPVPLSSAAGHIADLAREVPHRQQRPIKRHSVFAHERRLSSGPDAPCGNSLTSSASLGGQHSVTSHKRRVYGFVDSSPGGETGSLPWVTIALLSTAPPSDHRSTDPQEQDLFLWGSRSKAPRSESNPDGEVLSLSGISGTTRQIQPHILRSGCSAGSSRECPQPATP